MRLPGATRLVVGFQHKQDAERFLHDLKERRGRFDLELHPDKTRLTGAVYKASGWIHVGTTQGRGRYDTHRKQDKPKKDIWLRPLRKDWKRILNR